jgi:hypothetical protein
MKPATIPPVAQPAAPPVVAKQPAKAPAQKAPAQKVPVQKAPSGPDLFTRIKQIPAAVAPVAQSIVRSVESTLPKGKARSIALMAAVVVVVAIIASVYFLTRGPVPTGTLVIEAAPWGTVTGIRTASGKEQTVPAGASTPLSIAVPAGTYQVTVTGPNSKTATVTAQVGVGAIAIAPIARFDTVTVEQYFEQYLGALAVSSDAAAPAPAADAASAPATPAAAGGNQ